MKDKKIFIVEDDKNIRRLLENIFIIEGAKVTALQSGMEFLKVFEKSIPDIVILDIMLPDIDGYTICKRILEKEKIPIIMITAKSHIDDKIKGLEIGADDYITKPFHIKEVILRVKKLLEIYENNSSAHESSNIFILTPNIIIHLEDYKILIDGKNKKLNPKEFELLKYLIENRGRIVYREKILDSVWGMDFYGDIRTVDINIQRIRKKLGLNKEENIIETIFGVGYRLNLSNDIKNVEV